MFIRKRAHIGTDLLLVVSIMYLCIQRLDQSSSQCMVVRSKQQVHHYQAFFSEINWHFIFLKKKPKRNKKLKKKKKSVDLQFFSKLLLVCLKKLVTKLCNNIVHQQYTTMQQSSANMPLLCLEMFTLVLETKGHDFRSSVQSVDRQYSCVHFQIMQTFL